MTSPKLTASSPTPDPRSPPPSAVAPAPTSNTPPYTVHVFPAYEPPRPPRPRESNIRSSSTDSDENGDMIIDVESRPRTGSFSRHPPHTGHIPQRRRSRSRSRSPAAQHRRRQAAATSSLGDSTPVGRQILRSSLAYAAQSKVLSSQYVRSIRSALSSAKTNAQAPAAAAVVQDDSFSEKAEADITAEFGLDAVGVPSPMSAASDPNTIVADGRYIASSNRMAVSLEVPGIKRGDLRIGLSTDPYSGVTRLNITAFKRQPWKPQSQLDYSERLYGKFDRKLTVPHNTKAQDIKTILEDGILTVTFPCGRILDQTQTEDIVID